MNRDKPTSAASLDATSSSAAARKRSEADYLAKQAESAQAAIAVVLEEMKADLQNAADVRQWAKAYPWASVGVAAGAGLVAGLVLTPRRKKTGPAPVAGKTEAPAPERNGKKEKSPWMSVLGHLFELAKPAISSAIAANLAARATAPEEDGQPHPQEAEAGM